MNQQIHTNSNQNNPLFTNREKLFKPAVIFLMALYFFGFLGMHVTIMNEYMQLLTPFESFISLTPLNLLITSSLLLVFHKEWNWQFVLFIVLSIIIGFIAEVVGVATGAIFGEYTYGTTLGWKWWDVPLVIGLNWFLLSYICSSLALRFFSNLWIRTLCAASLMVILDFLIEPVAIEYNFWRWETEEVPIQNYIAWFIIAFLPCYLFFSLEFKRQNQFAIYVFGAQFLFFLMNNIFI